MTSKITGRQKEVLDIIYKSIRDFGYPPTLAELKESLKVRSNQAVLDFLKILESKKIIEREDGAARAIKITGEGFNILGTNPLIHKLGVSRAGSLTPAFPWNEMTQPFTDRDIAFANDTFAVEISGDSMIDAGIYPRDHLLAKVSEEFSNRDIVVVQVGDAITVKRFVTQNRPPHIFLKPENKKYDIILFTEDTKMQAKIIGKYKDDEIIPINSKTKSFM